MRGRSGLFALAFASCLPAAGPASRCGPPEVRTDKNTIRVEADGAYRWNGCLVSEQTFRNLISAMQMGVTRTHPDILVLADAGTPYARVGAVIFRLQRAGVQRIAFISEPPIVSIKQ